MNRLLYLSYALLICLIINPAKAANRISGQYSHFLLEKSLPAPQSFAPIPRANTRFWVEKIPEAMRNDYIQHGRRYAEAKWTPIPDTIFQEYKRNGNRDNYEHLSFGTRRQMAWLVMAEIMEHKGVFMPQILRGLRFFLKEKWWGVSAHYPLNHPEVSRQVVDLFNAETANLIAWTAYMLHDELEAMQPGICTLINKEIDRRILTPCRTQSNANWKNKVDNWNTWICANWLSCLLFCEDNRNEQIEGVEQILKSLDAFVDGYPDDGGCDEGVHYWDRAAASLFESIWLLRQATNTQTSLPYDNKIKAMGSYVYKSYIGKKSYLTFADTPNYTQVNINILFPFGKYIGDSYMTGYAAFIAKENNYATHPSLLYDRSGNYPSLSRELQFLYQYSEFKKTEPAEPLFRDIWLPNLQIAIAREKEGKDQGLYFAAKGGNNDEQHNHNDVGNFIVYGDALPIIIDLGKGTYSAETFSANRYRQMNSRSAYHNVPIINGKEQREGMQYKAYDVSYETNDSYTRISEDIASAYPEEANVRKWLRTITFNRGHDITIEESYRLRRLSGPTEVILLVYGKPRLSAANSIIMQAGTKNYQITFPVNKLTPIIEKVAFEDQYLKDLWNDNVWRIRLVVSSNKRSDTISYTIAPK